MLRHLAPLVTLIGLAGPAASQDLSAFERFPVPVGQDAREPSLFATSDGRLLMSWLEDSGGAFAVKVSTLEEERWSAPETISASPDLFVNWADFPSVSEFSDGTMIAHWLQRSGSSAYAYDVRIALSKDAGGTWSRSLVPHGDGTKAQHGFVTLAPLDEKLVAVWLDGRAYDGGLVEDGAVAGQMQLRASVIASDRAATPDVAVDLATCSCCQTAAAISGKALLVVYRDRTEDEIRDIALTRFQDGGWSAPLRVHADNWDIPGCPINGPSIAANGPSVVVAWFTAAGDMPAVKVAFSEDAGETFGDAVRIDRGQPVGRVDTLKLEDGTALVSWIEWRGSDEILLVCQVTADGCSAPRTVAVNTAGQSMNFPQLAATPEGIYLAWTQPLSDGRDTIRILRAPR